MREQGLAAVWHLPTRIRDNRLDRRPNQVALVRSRAQVYFRLANGEGGIKDVQWLKDDGHATWQDLNLLGAADAKPSRWREAANLKERAGNHPCRGEFPSTFPGQDD